MTEKELHEILQTCDKTDLLTIRCTNCNCEFFNVAEICRYLPVTNPKNTSKHPITGKPIPITLPQQVRICASCGKPMDYPSHIAGIEPEEKKSSLILTKN